MQYIVDGQQYYHIKEFAQLTGLSVQAIRYLCFHGNASGLRLRCHYEGSRLYINVLELTEYPFMKGGHNPALNNVYHYRQIEEGKYERYLCEACTNGNSYNHNENMLNMQTLATDRHDTMGHGG